MLKRFIIKNFKSFREVEIKSLQRCNLIAGKNNVGKTSLLEALFLHEGAHNASLVINIETLRGITQFNTKEFVTDLFAKFKGEIEISLEAEYEGGKHLLLKISRDTSERATPVGFGSAETQDNKNVSPKIIFDAIEDGKSVAQSEIYLAADKANPNIIIPFFKGSNKMLRPVAVFASAGFSKVEKNNINVARFSAQVEHKRKQRIIDSLRLIDKNLQNLELSKCGNENLIFGDVGFDKLIPISLLGEGVERYLSLVLSLFTAENGVVLIDEIENGFHYSIHSQIWRNLVILAREFNVQIIATTHSHEFIEAAHKSYAGDKEYDFALHRFDLVGERHEDVVYDRATLEASLEDNMEIR